jgi:hypothetical protein
MSQYEGDDSYVGAGDAVCSDGGSPGSPVCLLCLPWKTGIRQAVRRVVPALCRPVTYFIGYCAISTSRSRDDVGDGGHGRTSSQALAEDLYESTFASEESQASVPYHERTAMILRDAVKKLQKKGAVPLERWVY